MQAKFANIGGLKVRAPVKSAGVVVGRVADIRFDNESYEAIVSMNIDHSYQFPRDTTAKILTSGLLGEQYVGLEAGGDGVMLKNGDRMRLTQSAVVLENLISQFLFNKAAEGKDGSQGTRSDACCCLVCCARGRSAGCASTGEERDPRDPFEPLQPRHLPLQRRRSTPAVARPVATRLQKALPGRSATASATSSATSATCSSA